MKFLQLGVVSALLLGVVLSAPRIVSPENRPDQTVRTRLTENVRKRPPRTDYHIRFQPDVFDRANSSHSPDQSISTGSPPPPSPGIVVGTTWYDMQHSRSLGKQIARNSGGNFVHMTWTQISDFDPSGNWDQLRVMYNSYRISTGTLFPGLGGEEISLATLARPRHANIAVDDAGAAHVSFAQREDVAWPLTPWAAHLPTPGNTTHFDDALIPSGTCGEALWPRMAVQQRAGTDDIRHVIAMSGTTCNDDRIFYWRFAANLWSGPVIIDSSFSAGYVITADKNSDKVAIIFHDIDGPGFNGANNIVYYQSTTAGAGWQSGAELGPSFKQVITNYTDTVDGPQAWQHIDAAYDNTGALHVIWDEQRVANKTTDAAIRHWNNVRNTIRPVALGYWDNPFLNFRLNLTGLSIGIGDGTTTCGGTPNNDFVYVTYTQFAGATAAEQADVAGPPGSQTHPNGELYLVSSRTGGNTWSIPANLSNTKTPNCRPSIADSVCRSEDWATINKTVSDIDILYISDRDPGAAPMLLSSYQPDDVMYLRITGGVNEAQFVCPALAPSFATVITSDVECEYNAEPGATKSDEFLYILNLGNADLSGTISILPGSPWLSILGAGSYTIPGGGADLVYTLTMDATSLTEGLYTATVRITHNDPSKPSPQDYPINFFVLTDFDCPQSTVISTGVE